MTLPLGIYEHSSGKQYRVLGVCRHSETLEPMVVYQALYGNFGLWVRPLTMFKEIVTRGGVQTPRFKFIASLWTEPPEIH